MNERKSSLDWLTAIAVISSKSDRILVAFHRWNTPPFNLNCCRSSVGDNGSEILDPTDFLGIYLYFYY